MTTRKELMNEAVDVLFVSAGVVGLSIASNKLLGKKLTEAKTLKDLAKLAVAVTASTMLVLYAPSKKWIPEDPFKSV